MRRHSARCAFMTLMLVLAAAPQVSRAEIRTERYEPARTRTVDARQ